MIYKEETLDSMPLADLHSLQRIVIRETASADELRIVAEEYRQRLVNERFEIEEAIIRNSGRRLS